MHKISKLFLCALMFLCVACSKTKETEETVSVVQNEKIVEEIKERGYLIVGVKTDVPDLSYFDGSEYSGLEIELAYKSAANIFGVSVEEAKENNLVQFVGCTVENREEKLENGEVDCLFCTYTITSARKKKFALSNSYYKDYIGLMVLKSVSDSNSLGSTGIHSIADLDGKIIGVPKNATTRKAFLNYIDTMNTIKVSCIFNEYVSYDALFKALKKGEIDVMSVDVSILKGYVDSSTTILNDRFAAQNYGAAVKLENQALLEYINQAINN